MPTDYLSVETEKENAEVAAHRAANAKAIKAERRTANEARLRALAAQEKEKRLNPRSQQPAAQKPRPKPQKPAPFREERNMLVLEEPAPPTPKDLASLEYPLDVLIPDEEHIPRPPSIASSFVAPPSLGGDRPPTGSAASRPGTGASRPRTAASAFDMMPSLPPTASRQPTAAADRPPTASRPGTSVSQLQRDLQRELANDGSGRFAQCLQQQGVKILNDTPRGSSPFMEGFAEAAVRPGPIPLPVAPVGPAPGGGAAKPIVWDTDISSGRPKTGSRPPSSRGRASQPPSTGARGGRGGADERATMAELLVSEAPLSARSSRIGADRGKKRIEARAAQSSLSLADM